MVILTCSSQNLHSFSSKPPSSLSTKISKQWWWMVPWTATFFLNQPTIVPHVQTQCVCECWWILYNHIYFDRPLPYSYFNLHLFSFCMDFHGPASLPGWVLAGWSPDTPSTAQARAWQMVPWTATFFLNQPTIVPHVQTQWHGSLASVRASWGVSWLLFWPPEW